MTLFLLAETSAGYALFKAKDKKLLKNESLGKDAETAEGISSMLKLKTFQKFDSAAMALEEVASIVEGKVTPMLAKLLDSIKDEKKASLAVADPKLGQAINKLPQLQITPISDSATNELYRAVRDHLPSLIPGLLPENISTMSLGLSHSLSRHKLRFSPDKVDTMIVQAISLLDDLDKELNTYAMRVKEWYGWHFPEMGRIVNDNLAYSRVILKMGMRTNAANADLADILPEEIEAAVKAAAEVSMGTEITEQDLDNIKLLAEQVAGFTEYRQQLSSYLSSRMHAIAPNLTELVGELVGARLIAHAGSLMNLAKSPASTIQILGAEKALFRALKTKHDTPKYGLIYHASLVGQATGKNKGKIARVLAAKAAIGMRVDALSSWSAEGEGKGDDVDEEERSALGVASRAKIERQLRKLEGKPLLPRGVAVGPNGTAITPGKWEVKEARKYNADADGLAGDEPAAIEPEAKEPKKGKKEKKEKKKEAAPKIEVVQDDSDVDSSEEEVEESEDEEEDEEDEEEEEDEDEDMADVEAGLGLPAPSLNGTKAKPVANDDTNEANLSDTLSTVSNDTPNSPDSPTQQETNWQSSILGNTKDAKKARKAERHARKLAMSEEKSKKRAERQAKIERRLDRKERRARKAEQVERREDLDEAKYGKLARAAGISVSKYKRKAERGEIKMNPDGTPIVISKKDIKKMKKEETKAAATNGDVETPKKRKREEDGEKSDKKKKKSKA
ncbi:MAG: Nucleolar protein 58 [Claussenomyces sp. TS43310]|nr:MAG: Nucleolar protein 58 [Claussenomyces sp. TS43310]